MPEKKGQQIRVARTVCTADQNSEVRRAAVEALGKLGKHAAKAVPALTATRHLPLLVGIVAAVRLTIRLAVVLLAGDGGSSVVGELGADCAARFAAALERREGATVRRSAEPFGGCLPEWWMR